MKREKVFLKVLFVLITIVLVTIILSGTAYASSFVFNADCSKTKVKPGDNTTIVLKVSDIVDVNNLGINTVEADIEYDEKALESINSSNMEGKNNWTITYNSKTKHFLVHNMISGVKEEKEIGQIKFKVKDDVKSGTKTTIRFKNITSNDGSSLLREADKEIELTIEGNGLAKIQTVKANGKIPQTGETETITISILGICALGVVSFIKFKNIDK